jgi:hypothetical protein
MARRNQTPSSALTEAGELDVAVCESARASPLPEEIARSAAASGSTEAVRQPYDFGLFCPR